MNTEKVEIYAVTHKEIEKIPKERILIGVGNNRNNRSVLFYDNTGENISEKNDSYCELTALYWIWKNSNADIVGLEHYRRFFWSNSLFRRTPLSIKQMLSRLRKYDIIVAKGRTEGKSLYEHYKSNHIIDDLDKCIRIIDEKYPEYKESCKKVLESPNGCFYNMFVMKKQLADQYCEWLFDILFELEKEIDLSNRDAYQERVFGFLSERLFNIWIDKQNLKVFYTYGHGYNDTTLQKIKRKLNQKG